MVAAWGTGTVIFSAAASQRLATDMPKPISSFVNKFSEDFESGLGTVELDMVDVTEIGESDESLQLDHGDLRRTEPGSWLSMNFLGDLQSPYP